MKIYVAARYTRKDEARLFAELLADNGFEITSTWFTEDLKPTVTMAEMPDQQKLDYAKRDIAEVNAADVLVLLSDGPMEKHPRGGKHVEMGYALGKGKQIIVYGPVENIFHLLPGVSVADSFAELTRLLRMMRTAKETLDSFGAELPDKQFLLKRDLRANWPTGAGEVRVTDPVTGGQKGSKPCRMDLIPPTVTWDLGLVYGMGAVKYDDYNWLKGYRWSLSIAALFRHLGQFLLGEYRDKESGLPHLAHVIWHCATLMEFNRLGKGTDDRQITKEGKE